MKITITFIGLLLLFTTHGYCAERNSDVNVKKLSGGWYKSATGLKVDEETDYYVDTIAQMCFIVIDLSHCTCGHTTYTPLPCSNLKKRPEWKDIIIWE